MGGQDGQCPGPPGLVAPNCSWAPEGLATPVSFVTSHCSVIDWRYSNTFTLILSDILHLMSKQ